MSETAEPLRWTVVEPVGGVTVHAFFFVPHAFALLDAVRKELPVFGAPLPEPVHVGGTEFRLGRLQGEPAALYLHGNGYLSITRAAPSEDHDGSNWRTLLQPTDIWIALANAMAVSATMRQPASALLRASGALYFLAPSPPVMRKLLQALTPTEPDEPVLSAADVAQLCLADAS